MDNSELRNKILKDTIYISDKEIDEYEGVINNTDFEHTILIYEKKYKIVAGTIHGYSCIEIKTT